MIDRRRRQQEVHDRQEEQTVWIHDTCERGRRQQRVYDKWEVEKAGITCWTGRGDRRKYMTDRRQDSKEYMIGKWRR
jgi:hypothetical protein